MISINFIRMAMITLVAICLGSCTNMYVRSRGFMPISVSKKAEYQKRIEVDGQKEFYLWGIVDNDNTVNLDEVFFDAGLVRGSLVEFTEYQSIENFLKAIFSFGFYIPKNYKVIALGITPND